MNFKCFFGKHDFEKIFNGYARDADFHHPLTKCGMICRRCKKYKFEVLCGHIPLEWFDK